jgi:hypothetical protein
MAITLSGNPPAPAGAGNPFVNTGTNTRAMPPRTPDPRSKNPVDQINSNPYSRSGTTFNGSTVVGKPSDQSGVAARTAAFTATNSSDIGGSSALTAAQKQANLDAVAQREKGILGCIGKSPTSPGQTPGCNNPCDTVDCLTTLLTGNLLDLDAKNLLCGVISSTESAIKRQIDATGDQLLDAAQTLTSLAPIVAPLNSLQNFVNGIDPGAIAKCLGAQALKDKVNGKFNEAKNTINNFQNGYQDKLAEKFNGATAAAQQFSITPNLCASKSPASLRSLLG